MSAILGFLQESLFLIIVFGAFLFYAMMRSTQALIDLILGLYMALLISLKFPYYDLILGDGGAKTQSVIAILVFAFFALLATWLFRRLMPPDSIESSFEYFGQKFMFAAAATVLIMIFSYHVLPVTEFVTPGSPINYLFGSEANFFWWLLVPLVLLFLL